MPCLCDTNYNTWGSIEQFKVFIMLLFVLFYKCNWKNNWHFQSMSPLKKGKWRTNHLNKTKQYSSLFSMSLILFCIINNNGDNRCSLYPFCFHVMSDLWIYKNIDAYLWTRLWSFSMHFFNPSLKYSSRVFLHQCTLSCCCLPQWTVANFFIASA